MVVPFLRNNPSAVMFFQRFKFPAKTLWEKYSEYKIEGKQLHFHISRHIAHLGWETPVFFTLFTLSTYGTVVYGKNIRSASGFFIAGNPFVKIPGFLFLHFRLE
jgi:hypothetical protein